MFRVSTSDNFGVQRQEFILSRALQVAPLRDVANALAERTVAEGGESGDPVLHDPHHTDRDRRQTEVSTTMDTRLICTVTERYVNGTST
jgi:hypothetical protein